MPRLSDFISRSPAAEDKAQPGAPSSPFAAKSLLQSQPNSSLSVQAGGAPSHQASGGAGAPAGVCTTAASSGAGAVAGGQSSSNGGSSSVGGPGLGSRVEAGIARLQRQYQRRLQDHGPRKFRQPNGSLSAGKPPLQPLAVANRRRWWPLVQHCRNEVSQDPTILASGAAALYGAPGVTPEQRARALAAAGLSPEVDASGAWLGFEPGLEDPIEDDPAHALWGEEWGPPAAAVLERAERIGNLERAGGRGRGVAGVAAGVPKAARASSPLSVDSEGSFVVL